MNAVMLWLDKDFETFLGLWKIFPACDGDFQVLRKGSLVSFSTEGMIIWGSGRSPERKLSVATGDFPAVSAGWVNSRSDAKQCLVLCIRVGNETVQLLLPVYAADDPRATLLADGVLVDAANRVSKVLKLKVERII